jgi:hypothetical protein
MTNVERVREAGNGTEHTNRDLGTQIAVSTNARSQNRTQ